MSAQTDPGSSVHARSFHQSSTGECPWSRRRRRRIGRSRPCSSRESSSIGSSFRAAAERNRWNTVEFVRAGEYAVESEVGGRRINADRGDVDAVAVVVERDFVQQPWVDDLRVVHHARCTRGCRSVLPIVGTLSPLHIVVPNPCANLFRDPVSEDGVLAVEFVINAHDLFTNIGRRARATLELCCRLLVPGKYLLLRASAARSDPTCRKEWCCSGMRRPEQFPLEQHRRDNS